MSFLASLPANLVKFSSIAVGIPTYIYSSDTALLLETVVERVFEIFDLAVLVEIPVKVVSDISTLIDEFKSITIPTSDTASLTDRTIYMSKQTRDSGSFTDLLTLKLMVESEYANLTEYLKLLPLENVTEENLEEYLLDLPTLMKSVLPNIISKFRYVSYGDMILASDYNEILAFIRAAMKIILAVVKILLDENIDIPEELSKLIGEVTSLIW